MIQVGDRVYVPQAKQRYLHGGPAPDVAIVPCGWYTVIAVPFSGMLHLRFISELWFKVLDRELWSENQNIVI